MVIPVFRLIRLAPLSGGLLMAAAGLVPAQDSPHGKISFACEECHTSQQKNEYVGLRTDCQSCHAQYCCQSSGCYNSCQGGG